MKAVIGLNLFLVSLFAVANVVRQGGESRCDSNIHSPTYCVSKSITSSTSNMPTVINGDNEIQGRKQVLLSELIDEVHGEKTGTKAIMEVSNHLDLSPEELSRRVRILEDNELEVNFTNLNK